MSSPNNVVLGQNLSHYYSHGDSQGRCPSCYTNNVAKIGILTIEGSPRDVHKCNNCNRLYSGPDGGIRSLVDEAKEVFDTDKVGFTAITDGSSGSPTPLPTNVSLEGLNEMNNKLEDLTDTIKRLVSTVRDMSVQNHDLMEKLMTDPLNGMRKAVSEFNLE